MSSLLDSICLVTLMCQNYFNYLLRPMLEITEGLEATAHNMLKSKGINKWGILLIKYCKMDIKFLKKKVPSVRFLVSRKQNELFNQNHNKILLGIMQWKLLKLAYQEFLKKYRNTMFENLECLIEVDPLLMSQLSVHHYSGHQYSCG